MNNKKIFILIVITLFFLVFAYIYPRQSKKIPITQEPSEISTTVTTGYLDITPAEANDLIAENPELIIIDVSPHYDKGHLPNAISYYLGDGSLEKAIPDLDKDATYLVYCHLDSVSIQGSQMLVDAGFMSVYRLEGNYAAWLEAGYDIEK